jgi:hypothetical protein
MHGVYALSAGKWALAAGTAFLVGNSKTGIPALGILLAPLFAEVLPARASTGALLPLLIVADAFGVILWRRHGSWKHLGRLLPWAFAAIAGFLSGATTMLANAAGPVAMIY